jgi:hypothetical protein
VFGVIHLHCVLTVGNVDGYTVPLHALKTWREKEFIGSPSLNLGTRLRFLFSFTPWPLYPWRNSVLSPEQWAGLATDLLWTLGRFPGCPARSLVTKLTEHNIWFIVRLAFLDNFSWNNQHRHVISPHLHMIRGRKANWICCILRGNCHIKDIIERKREGTRRRGRRRKQLLHYLKETRRY